MKKLSISFALVFSSLAAFAGGSFTESVSNNSGEQTAVTRSLDGNKLTTSVCSVSVSAEGTRSRCVSETQKLTRKEVQLVHESLQFEQQALLMTRSASSTQQSSFKSQAMQSAIQVSVGASNAIGRGPKAPLR